MTCPCSDGSGGNLVKMIFVPTKSSRFSRQNLSEMNRRHLRWARTEFIFDYIDE